MIPQPAVLLVYSPLNQQISDLDNFTSIPHLNHCELILKSPKKIWLARN